MSLIARVFATALVGGLLMFAPSAANAAAAPWNPPPGPGKVLPYQGNCQMWQYRYFPGLHGWYWACG